jgi:DNA ligase-3
MKRLSSLFFVCLGLVLKDLKSQYEPGKRHWLKVKKDYLNEGAMADSADLVVLGAWYGSGNKGGLMSIFLMGCYDEDTKRF